jgi:hypothetical protein
LDWRTGARSWLETVSTDEIGVDHVARGVEGAQRNRTDSKDVRDPVHGAIRRLGPFADENGVARSVGSVGRLVEVVEQQQCLALLDVSKLDAIGKAGARVGDQALHAEALQFVVGKSVEATKGRGVETRDLERHGRFSL